MKSEIKASKFTDLIDFLSLFKKKTTRHCWISVKTWNKEEALYFLLPKEIIILAPWMSHERNKAYRYISMIYFIKW